MRKLPLLASIFTLATLNLRADSFVSPVLQWVKAFSGTGSTSVAAASVDPQGNFYILANTTSFDLPTTQALRPAPSASTLSRITSSTAAVQKIDGPSVANIGSIAADAQNPQSLYATTPNVLLHSTDAGETWTPLPGSFSPATLQCVTVDPTNGSTVYVGTSSAGVFKSTNGGMTWSSHQGDPNPASIGTLSVYDLWIDPNSPQVLFAVSSGGTQRSTNGGTTWTPVPGVADTGTQSLTFDPFSPGTLYVVFGSSIYRSTDDGVTFARLSHFPVQPAPFAIVPDPLHRGVLFASTSLGIYRSADSGATWSLKVSGTATLMAAGPNSAALYAVVNGRLFKSTDGFSTYSLVETLSATPEQIQVAGPYAFVLTYPPRPTGLPSSDIYVAKLDTDGNVKYATYFGGSSTDTAVGLAVGKDGSVYVTGTTNSVDFPTTPGAYVTALPSASGGSFVFKLQPEGSLAWSTFFADTHTIVNAIAVDAVDNPYIAGSTAGGIPTTTGAYVTQFQSISTCISGFISICNATISAFLTKFEADGTGLVFSTYIPQAQNAEALVLDPNGNAYLGGGSAVYQMNTTGSALLASTGDYLVGPITIGALALDSNLNVYATGATRYVAGSGFPATSQAFQKATQPAIPSLRGDDNTKMSNACVMKWDSALTQILAATLLGGEKTDAGESIAINSNGDVIVSGYSDSKAFPTRAPFQASFSPRSGFVAGLNSSLSHLLFSTYLGDTRPFDAHVALPDGKGNVLVAGYTLSSNGSFIEGDNGFPYAGSGSAFVNKIALPQAPSARLDSVVNYASRIAGALSPGEAIAVLGSGFGPDTQLLIDGAPLPLFSQSATALVAVLPETAKTSGAVQVMVSTGGAHSNPLLVPAAAASPGIFTVDGSGVGQGYILNSDGTLNSPSNPATVGSSVNIYATGVGPISYTGPYAVTGLPVSVFIAGWYAAGIAAVNTPVEGQPGLVFQIGVYVPDPAAGQVSVELRLGHVNSQNPVNSAMISQAGLALSVKQ